MRQVLGANRWPRPGREPNAHGQIPLCQLSRDVRQTRDVPFSPNSITPTSPMEFGLKGTSRVCRELVANVTGKSATWNVGFTRLAADWSSISDLTLDTERSDRSFYCVIAVLSSCSHRNDNGLSAATVSTPLCHVTLTARANG